MRLRLVVASCIVLVLSVALLPFAPRARAATTDKIDPALTTLMNANPLSPLPVIVEMQPPLAPFAPLASAGRTNEALDLLRLNGTPAGGLSLINSAAGFANAAGIEAMSLVPTVAYIHYDATVGPRRGGTQTVTAAELAAVYPRVVKADQLWHNGTTGLGVTVAVLDSGVASDPDLTQPTNRILASVNFAGERLTSDPGGHGTNIAGIIAGNGRRSDGEFIGIAPQANIVDVRVLNNNGSGRISSLVRGIEWVVTHRSAYNIRVINLSFGAHSSGSYRTDPLAAAVEVAWRVGLVVVAAAGNSGPQRDSVVTPGTDPYVITVGATDDAGTLSTADDTLVWFSSWGSADSNAKPDLVAPGRRIVSLRVPGSTLDVLFPDRVVTAQNGATYFRLSGTSMATAVASGAAALLLQRRPDLAPDQVKAALVGSTQPFGGSATLPDPIAAGSGLLDVNAAAAATTSRSSGGTLGPLAPVDVSLAAANRGLRPADGFARSLYAMLYGTPLRWKNLSLDGILWGSLTWDSVNWDSVAWDNFDWDSVGWDSVGWDSVGWDSVGWDSVGWDSVGWDSVGWDSVGWDAFSFD